MIKKNSPIGITNAPSFDLFFIAYTIKPVIANIEISIVTDNKKVFTYIIF